jgi:hypothetical protein
MANAHSICPSDLPPPLALWLAHTMPGWQGVQCACASGATRQQPSRWHPSPCLNGLHFPPVVGCERMQDVHKFHQHTKRPGQAGTNGLHRFHNAIRLLLLSQKKVFSMHADCVTANSRSCWPHLLETSCLQTSMPTHSPILCRAGRHDHGVRQDDAPARLAPRRDAARACSVRH